MAGEGYTFKPQDIENAFNGFKQAAQQIASLQMRIVNRKGQMDGAQGWADEAYQQFDTPYTKATQRFEKASEQFTNIAKMLEDSLAEYREKIEAARVQMQNQR
jgi:hypothetical protein